MSCLDIEKSKKRKSYKIGNMGDVLGKECGDGEKDEMPHEIIEEFVREEADGAPSGDEKSSESSVDTEGGGDLNGLEGDELLDEIQRRLTYNPASASPKSPVDQAADCTCEACKSRRQQAMEHDEELQRLTSYWMELRWYIRSVYHFSATARPKSYDFEDNGPKIKDLIHKLCARDPHQLFQRLERVVQDFVYGIKNELMALIEKEEQTVDLPRTFITGLLDRYDGICWAARQLTPVLVELETSHLERFHLTWDLFNKHVYLTSVYTDPQVQDNLPRYIAQLRNLLPGKNDSYCELVYRYLGFDDEMTLVGEQWRNVEVHVDKYNQEQAVLKAKQLSLRQDWELFKAQRKLVQKKMWTKTASELRELDERFMSLASLRLCGAAAEGAEANGEAAAPCGGCAGRCSCDECSLAHLLTCGALGAAPDAAAALYQQMGLKAGSRRADSEGAVGGEPDLIPPCECRSCASPPACAHILPASTLPIPCTRIPPALPVPCTRLPPAGGLAAAAMHCFPHVNGVGGHRAEEDDDLYPLAWNQDVCSAASDAAAKTVANKSPPCKTPPKAPPCKATICKTPPSKTPPCKTPPCKTPPCKSLPCKTPPCKTPPFKTLGAGLVASLTAALPKSPAVRDLSSMATQTSPSKAKAEPVGKSTAAPMASLRTSLSTSTNTPPTTSSTGTSTGTSTGMRKPLPVSECGIHHIVRHSTTQTHGHGGHTCQPLPDLVKSAARAAAAKPAATPGHSCHKSREPVKRVACADYHDGDGVDCEDSSSQDDSCSERSSSTTTSAQRDSRHCDCCYCEVFGHGMPSVAPVSRNYQEMRERLRLLLTKKKAKCKVAPPATALKASVPPGTASLPDPGKLKPQTASVPATAAEATAGKSGSESSDSTHPGYRDIDTLMDFIEGNQPKKCKPDSKKAAKRLKQKQKKQEEKERLEEEELERERIDAIRTKNPEVTITVVNKGSPSPAPPPLAPPSKLSKKAKAAAAAEEAAEAAAVAEALAAGPQMVTIKRVKESNPAEPTVTITLKGATPDKDKVLFTLVHGGQSDYELPYLQNGANGSKQPVENTAKTSAAVPNGKKGKKGKAAVTPAPTPVKVAAVPKPAAAKPAQHSTVKPTPPKPAKCPPGKTQPEKPEPAKNQTKPVAVNGLRNEQAVGDGARPLGLDSFRLPPGITITKVDGPSPVRRPQPRPEPPRPRDDAYSTTIIAAPGVSPTPRYEGAGHPANVIVVDTGRMIERLDGRHEEETVVGNSKKKNKKNKSKANEVATNGAGKAAQNNNVISITKLPNTVRVTQQSPQQVVRPNGYQVSQPQTPPPTQAAIIKLNGSMVSIKNPMYFPSVGDANRCPPPMVNGRSDVKEVAQGKKGAAKKAGGAAMVNGVKGKENYVLPPRFSHPDPALRSRIAAQMEYNGMHGVPGLSISKVSPSGRPEENGQAARAWQLAAARTEEAATADGASADAKKKKNRKKRNGAGQGNVPEPDLVDSVFAPKDIDLDNGDIDDDERELEAFKRFCFNSVPPKQKEKVHLNIKDLVIKKKAAAIGCS